MEYALAVGMLAAVVVTYFLNNPLRHGSWFLMRRFINWFPLGMTYAFLYMARLNLNVAKGALGDLMSKSNFGLIAGVGSAVYAASFLFNGPLVDRIGGKKGIIIAAVGASAANIVLGVLTFLLATGRLKMGVLGPFMVVYAINMYFQSYGAVSIIKVKAYWFHVRERGVFGAIFGSLISFGVYFAYDWGQGILNLTDVKATGGGAMGRLLRSAFDWKAGSVDSTWAVFFVPAAILLVWAALDLWLIKDTPEEAGFAPFDTHDASSGQMHVEFTTVELLKKVLTSRLMLLIAVVEFTSGVFRGSVFQWYTVFAKEMGQHGFYLDNWGLLLCVFGIIGGFAGGLISDKLFQSRRGPPAGILCAIVFVIALAMAPLMTSSPVFVVWSAIAIAMAATGITSLMSGTAATDFGGRKATATCSGIVDGFAYLGTSIQSVSLGYMTSWGWQWWPIFLLPVAVVGFWVSLKIWNELPPATRRYIADVENKEVPMVEGEAAASGA